MNARLRLGVAAACAALAAAACDAGNAFTGSFGTTGGAGSIQGQVTSNGTGVSGVPVILIDQDSTLTSGTGTFAFASVPSGTYQIGIRVPIGFSLAAGQTSPRSVVVSGGTTTGVTFLLQSTTIVP